jgi:hypothetical protein
MLVAQVREKFGGGLGTAGFHIFVASTDSLDRFREVLSLPFQIGRQRQERWQDPGHAAWRKIL